MNNQPQLDDWSLLAQLTLTRLVIFNKRRGGEASKLALKVYQERLDWSKANSSKITKFLNKFEKELSRR